MTDSALLEGLNPPQREAVAVEGGPVLVLAGAGSGKTRVLTHRIAHLTAAHGVPAQRILAVTFTNKAAGEMRERVMRLVPEMQFADSRIGTFHSICARLLRRDLARYADFSPNFTIYDRDDQLRAVKRAMATAGADDGKGSVTAKTFLSRISGAKGELQTPDELVQTAHTLIERRAVEVYRAYEAELAGANALDFDDLIAIPVRVLQREADLRALYQRRFEHILVDEYQDTNRAQYWLLRQLVGGNRNLFVVGDEDQSIYGWRGADVGNILNFERDYPDAAVIRLEQNYRSTRRILAAASSVIRYNTSRLGKELWTDGLEGERLTLIPALDSRDEAAHLVEEVSRAWRNGERALGDFAVLYRTNAQSRAIEDALRLAGLPYTIVGGVRFYERAEVKDVLAYLRALTNPRDTISLGRIINVPRRGIGAATLRAIEAHGRAAGCTLSEALGDLERIEGLKAGARARLAGFSDLMGALRALVPECPAATIAEEVLRQTDYIAHLRRTGDDDPESRVENVEELVTAIAQYTERTGDASLSGFLSEVALVTDIDQWEDRRDAVTLMTLHSAKGLEFPAVWITGLENGIFPLVRGVENEEEIEEERRLFYVGLTRAKERIYLSYAGYRFRYGGVEPSGRSRFLDEIPGDLIKVVGGGVAGKVRPERERTFEPVAGSRSDGPVEAVEGLPGLDVGAKVLHPAWGVGTVMEMRGRGKDLRLIVKFLSGGRKTLVARFATLEIL